MQATEQRERFRRVLVGDTCIRPASVFDPISARIADHLGFEIGMLAGSVASAVVLGAPDLVVLTLTELAGQVRRIMRTSDLSLMVDADHGYGNALNVMRTVEELEAAGVSALTIEDTLLPPPFGDQQSRAMLSIEEMVGKLKAALSARKDSSLVIIGRSSAVAHAGVEEATRRARAYTEAGVDAIFLAGVATQEDLQAIHQVTALPLILGGTPPALGDLGFLAESGARIALAGHSPFQAAIKAVYDVLKHLREGGSPAELRDRVASDDLMATVTRRDDYSRWQKEYLS